MAMVKILTLLAFACVMLDLATRVHPTSPPNCPPCNIRDCENETVLQESCPDAELVNDACGCCKRCGRRFSETCGGAYEYIGKCEYDLLCTASPSDYLNGVNISGVCTRKVCLRNCTKKAIDRLCGSDGRWYRNICALRQSKYCNGTGVSRASSLQICDRACREPVAPEYGNVTLTNGIAQMSVANFSCQTPYILIGSEKRTCSEGPVGAAWNGTQPVCRGTPTDTPTVPPTNTTAVRPTVTPTDTPTDTPTRPDPCTLHTCNYSFQVCTPDSNNEPLCGCGTEEECTEIAPVCASNGVTYRSECHMNVDSCRRCLADPSHCSGVSVYIVSRGLCPNKEENPDKRKR